MAAFLAAAAGCGGGRGSGAASTGSGQSYDFVAPALNSVRAYGETVTDNSNNTIDENFTITVTTVNSVKREVVLQTSSS